MDSNRPRVPHQSQPLLLPVSRRPGDVAVGLPSTLARSQPLFHLQVTTITKTLRNHHENGAMETEPPKRRSLESLPPELLHRVCFFLCGHCSDLLHFCGSGTWDQKPLNSLCKTSRLLLAIAQPYAYHVVSDDVPRPLALLRTILQNSRLASHIKAFRQAKDRLDITRICPGDVQIAGILGIDVRRYSTSSPSQANDSNFSLENGSTNLFIDMVLGSTPNLKYLVIYTQTGDSAYRTDFRYVAARLLAGIQSRPLQSLSYLGILNDAFGSDLGCCPAVRSLLLAAAPTLEQFFVMANARLHEINSGIVLPDFPSFKSLVLEGHLSQYWRTTDADPMNNSLIGHLLHSSPQLQVFQLWGCTRRGPPVPFIAAQQIVENICSKRGLRSLVLDFSFMRHDLLAQTRLTPESMNSFTSLEHLSLEDVLFCHHLQSASASTSIALLTQFDCLTSLLPNSTQKLTIRLYDYSPVWSDIKELAQDVSRGNFPRLRSVQVYISNTSEVDTVVISGRAEACFHHVVESFAITAVIVTMNARVLEAFTCDMPEHESNWRDV